MALGKEDLEFIRGLVECSEFHAARRAEREALPADVVVYSDVLNHLIRDIISAAAQAYDTRGNRLIRELSYVKAQQIARTAIRALTESEKLEVRFGPSPHNRASSDRSERKPRRTKTYPDRYYGD